MTYSNPRSTKYKVKLSFAYLEDIGIVGGLVFFAVWIKDALPLSGAMQLAFIILCGVFGVFLCIRMPAHPVDKIAMMLYHMARADRNKYHPIEIEGEMKL